MVKDNVTPIEMENERDEFYESDNPQLDSSRTKNNLHTMILKIKKWAVFSPKIAKNRSKFAEHI